MWYFDKLWEPHGWKQGSMRKRTNSVVQTEKPHWFFGEDHLCVFWHRATNPIPTVKECLEEELRGTMTRGTMTRGGGGCLATRREACNNLPGGSGEVQGSARCPPLYP